MLNTLALSSYVQEIPHLLNLARFPPQSTVRNLKQRNISTTTKIDDKCTASPDSSHMREAFEGCFLPLRRIRKAKLLTFKIDDTLTLSFIPATSYFYLQKRGFRTRSLGKSINSRVDSKTNIDSWLHSFRNMYKKEVPKEFESSDSWNVYKSALENVPKSERKSFTEGFLKGMSGNSDSTKRWSMANWIPVFSLICSICILAYLLRGQVSINIMETMPQEVNVTFDDVKGMDDAKHEVEEIVTFLRDPKKFSKLGGRLPKGVLLIGPPGTGKTLLARAIAGEAKVPFFRASGSEFDEMLVGMGARRVKSLFAKAKQRSPCIIFIDEIDSVGSKRVTSSLHPYANQTINQLLTEMDGFDQNEEIIVIGATNRVEDLDEALLRPGRFDLRTTISPPDLEGRIDILKLYLGKIVHDKNVSLRTLAKGTTGFTGADIESMVNQAALKAAAGGYSMVKMCHLDEAKDRLLMGPARVRGRLPDEEANKITAYHEAGHALVSLYTKDSIPLHKVTIIPRGQSLGHTAMLPEKDEYHVTRSQMLAQLDMTMAGRVAEELIFGVDKVTTGAADDLKKATIIASKMVKTFGMSEKVGLRDFSTKENALISMNELSPQTSEAIDQEINRLLNESYSRAKELLSRHSNEHRLLAETLLEHETLSCSEVKELLQNGELRQKFVKNNVRNVQSLMYPDGKCSASHEEMYT